MATVIRYTDIYLTNGVVVFNGTSHECHEYIRRANDEYVYSIK